MAARKNKKTVSRTEAHGAEVQSVAIILMNAVVRAIEDFESDQSFLVGMGSVAEDEIPEGGMEGAEALKESLTKYLGSLSPMSWKPRADDLGVLTEILSGFDNQGFLKIAGADKSPEVYVGWAWDFAWMDNTSEELESFAAVCKRVLLGNSVASNFEELKQVALVLSVDVRQDDGKYVVGSGQRARTVESVQEAVRLILAEEFRGLTGQKQESPS